MNIDHLLTGEIFAVFIVFCRIGTAIMLMPTVGENYVSARVRLLFALTVSFLLAEAMRKMLPPVPASVPGLAVIALREITIGVLLGMLTKIFLTSMHVAGTIIASQSGLSAAMMFDASQNTQSATLSIFMTLAATMMFVVMDLHHIMLGAFADSYNIFKAGGAIPLGDMSNYITRAIADSFSLGFRISAPVMVVAMFLNVGGGVMARLMPQMSVFFVIMPAQLGLSFAILLITISSALMWYSESAQDVFTHLLTR